VSRLGEVGSVGPGNAYAAISSATSQAARGPSAIAGLTADAAGNLYGTTSQSGLGGVGTVFKLTPTGVETVLYNFTGGADGGVPLAGLIADAAGNLYGTTQAGGASGDGTIFKVTPAGIETVLHSFSGANGDGASPVAGLIADDQGNLYGTTHAGGASNAGTVFKLTNPATFNGMPGQVNCTGQSLSFATKKYGGMAHAAAALGYASVADFQTAALAYCGG
jgi:uncharacterized repeat protein (TIGR03803 family)